MGVKSVLTLTVALLGAIVLANMISLAVALYRGGALADRSEAFQQRVPNARKTLLVIGDSTAVGTGAERPEDSVAGRIGSSLPGMAIVNLAEDGAKTQELMAQLRAAPDASYDAVLIQVGGNDVLRFTGITELRKSATALLSAAKAKAPYVAMMSSGDVGAAPAFLKPVDWVYSWRTRRVRSLFLELAARDAIDYVDLYDPSDDNPFYRHPDRYYAPDGLHPSAEGYRLWFEQLVKQSSIRAYLMAR
jgi:lysophospholipase L1-like esterase